VHLLRIYAKRVVNGSCHKFTIYIQLSFIILYNSAYRIHLIFAVFKYDLIINTCHYEARNWIYRNWISLITRRYLNHATARTVMRNSRVVYELTRVVYEGHISMRERLTLKCLHPLVGESSLCYTLHDQTLIRETNIVCAWPGRQVSYTTTYIHPTNFILYSNNLSSSDFYP